MIFAGTSKTENIASSYKNQVQSFVSLYKRAKEFYVHFANNVYFKIYYLLNSPAMSQEFTS